MKIKLIAPCGMNCGLCAGYLREKNKCPGCFAQDEKKAKYCRKCIIKNCQKRTGKYCDSCTAKYPCARLKNLDKRYRTKYKMSMLDNLEYIKKNGIRKFVQKEKRKWTKGGKIYCVHHKKYY